MIDDENSSGSCESPSDLRPKHGVLLVHDMGEHQRGDTLLQMGEPIVKWLNNWIEPDTAHDPTDTAIRLRCSHILRPPGNETTRPSHTILEPPSPVGLPIVLAESWWAEDFRPATFNEVLTWGIKVGPFALHDTLRSQWARKWKFIANLQLPLTFVLGPVLQLLLLCLVPLSVVPPFRKFAGSAMTRIGNSLGDPYLLVFSQFRLSSMVERIHHDLRWLQSQECERVSIVAHSQGAAVTNEALIKLPDDLRPLHIVRYVTFGAAIAKLRKLIGENLKESRRIRGGMFRNLILIAMVVTLCFSWKIDAGPFDGWGWSAIVWAVGTILFWIGDWHTARHGALAVLQTWCEFAVSIRGGPRKMAEVATSNQSTFSVSEADLWDRKTKWDASQKKFTKDAVWEDFFARADPVSLDGLEDAVDYDRGPSSSVEVRNRDSVGFDHTMYWANAEQFVSEVARGLIDDVGWALPTPITPTALVPAKSQRRIRVNAIVAAFVLASVSASAMLGLLWWGDKYRNLGERSLELLVYLSDRFPIPFEDVIGRNVEDPSVAITILASIAIVLITVAWYSVVVSAVWSSWNRAKARRLTSDGDLGGAWIGGIPFIIAVALTLVAVAGSSALIDFIPHVWTTWLT